MKKALAGGALGVTGRILVNHLVSLGDWEVIGLSRRSPEFQTATKQTSVDLSNRSTVSRPFGEAIFNLEYDVMSDTTKSRRCGFLEWADTQEMPFRLFTQSQKMRFIPVL
jgi:GDP-D-mannose dehydratase